MPPADDVDFGPNVGLVEEIYRQWLEDPDSVAESWQDFFGDYKPRLAKSGNGETAVAEKRAAAEPNPAPSAQPAQEPAPAPGPAPAPAPAPEGATPLKGAA